MTATGPLLPLVLTDVSYLAGGKRIIDRVSLEIEAGPRTVLLGPNGSGKRVLMRLCHGLLKPSSGEVRYRGPERAAGRRRHAMVFQRPVLLRRSALANVTYALSLAGLDRRDSLRFASEALDRVGLLSHASKPARVLSGASSSAWPLHALGPCVRNCCSSTSRLPASTPSPRSP